jgi:hypothetical protein
MRELEHAIFGLSANDEFHVGVTEKPEEIKKTPLETGFEYVCQEEEWPAMLRRRSAPEETGKNWMSAQNDVAVDGWGI